MISRSIITGLYLQHLAKFLNGQIHFFTVNTHTVKLHTNTQTEFIIIENNWIFVQMLIIELERKD